MSPRFKITVTVVMFSLILSFTAIGSYSQSDEFLYRLSPELRSHVPVDVRRSAVNWTPEQKDIFVARFNSQSKETTIAYITWFALGAHYAYLGDWGKQVLYWITGGGLGIWALIDLFNMEDLVREKNREIAREIAMEVENLYG